MKNSDFKSFKETVIKASKDNPIWFMGFAWLSLTNKSVGGYTNNT